MDSKLLMMGEQVPHCNCSTALCEGNELGQNGHSAKRKFFGSFIEQENGWLECWSLLSKAFPFLQKKNGIPLTNLSA